MSSRQLAVATLCLLMLVAGSWWLLGSRSDDERTALAARGSIDVTIKTVGTVQANDATVRSEVEGLVDQLGVAAGDTVEEGDIVALLDPEPLERAVTEAERGLEEAEYALQFAEQRATESPDDVGRKQELFSATNGVERAQQALDDASAALAGAVVLAPRAGTVLEVLIQQGDIVTAGQPVARVASVADLELIADLDELDLPHVHPGADAHLRFDAFPATEIPGTVVSTAPEAIQQGGATIFQATIAFEPPPDLDVRPGMNVEVTIVTDARTDVLLIPEAALRTVGDRTYVTVVTEDGHEEREVILGDRGNGQVEVVAGVAEGEHVLLR